MRYNLMQEKFINYFKKHETKREDKKIGIEFEHFIVNADNFESVSFLGKNGVQETLVELRKFGYEPIFEKEFLVGLKSAKGTITLEPGAQVEFSSTPKDSVVKIADDYTDFINEVESITSENNQLIVSSGYRLNDKISDIVRIPKDRYQLMESHFESCGKYAKNMMKGSASLQISLDYENEIQFRKMFQLAYRLVPVFSAIFDNSPIFEKELHSGHAIRNEIWENCDNERCGIIPNVFDEDFGYTKYADYLLNLHPILLLDKNNDAFGINGRVKDNLQVDELTDSQIAHVQSMVFPDVRAKHYVEFRVVDALPFPLSLTAPTMLKTLFYDIKAFTKADNLLRELTLDDIIKAKKEMSKTGIETIYGSKRIIDWFKELYAISETHVTEDEAEYLKVWQPFITEQTTLKNKVQKYWQCCSSTAIEFLTNSSLSGDEKCAVQ